MKNSKVHAIIIAAGCSTRLPELTKDKPKSFLEIGGKKIIDYHLDLLNERQCENVTIVVGYLRDLLMNHIGKQHKNLKINYVISEDYETTGHSWSVFQTKEVWEKEKSPVLLIHGDIFYHPVILDKVLSSSYENVLAVDNKYKVQTGDEWVVRGLGDMVEKIDNNEKDKSKIIGEIIGIIKWCPTVMEEFYMYLDQFFKKKGKTFHYEYVLSAMIHDKKTKIRHIKTDGLPWVNINYREDYERAQKVIYPLIYSS